MNATNELDAVASLCGTRTTVRGLLLSHGLMGSLTLPTDVLRMLGQELEEYQRRLREELKDREQVEAENIIEGSDLAEASCIACGRQLTNHEHHMGDGHCEPCFCRNEGI